MTDLTVTVKVRQSRKTVDKANLLAYIDRRAYAIIDKSAWLDEETGEPVIPCVLDEAVLQTLYEIRAIIESGNFAG